MSLRDQLLKAGRANKKDVARVDRQKRHERRISQANQRRKGVVKREEEASAEAERKAKILAKHTARKAREAERAIVETGLRVRQLIRGNAVRGRGKQPFWVKGADGRRVHRMSVADRVAFKLRCGELGIAGEPDSQEPVVVSKKCIDTLLDIAPQTVWFYVSDTSGISEADEAFLVADWEVSLVPHRQR